MLAAFDALHVAIEGNQTNGKLRNAAIQIETVIFHRVTI